MRLRSWGGLAAWLVVLGATGCIQEQVDGNCAEPGPGDPASKVDLQIVEETLVVDVEGTNAVVRVQYYNAGEAPATLAEGEEEILLAIYLDRASCPPAGEDADFLLGLPNQIPSGATAEVGITVPALASGAHNAFARVDPSNATWEADEFNNCDGPVDFTIP